MKATIKSILNSLGLLDPVVKIHRRHFIPRGIGNWDSLVPEKEYSKALNVALTALLEYESAENLGDYVEFGVSRGTSMAMTYHVLEKLNLKTPRLIGFDSFEGMPSGAEKEGWKPGDYHSTIIATKKYLRKHNVDMDRVTLTKGWFDDTLTSETRNKVGLEKASVIMIDCDIYSASMTSLRFSLPLIKEKAIIIFDDWGWTVDSDIKGQREAFQETLEELREFTTEPLPGYIPQSRIFLITRIDQADQEKRKADKSQLELK